MQQRWILSGLFGISLSIIGLLLFILFQNQKELATAIMTTSKIPAQNNVQVVEKVVVQQPWGSVQNRLNNTVVQIISQIAEVNILKPFETPVQHPVAGSGFFISNEGEIITNMHVIDQAKCVWVKIPSLGKAIIEAEIVGRCPERDLALLKITPEGKNIITSVLASIPYIELGDSDLVNRADEVLALGYPLGQASLKSTSGVVSGREHINGRHFIQISSPINPGSSGGPAVNLSGEVIGITCAGILGAQNVGYVIPVNELKLILADLRSAKLIKKPYLGILISPGSKDLALYLSNPLPSGCYVMDVFPGGPLDKAGVMPGDMLYEINHMALDEFGDIQVPWSEEKISFVDYISRWSIGDVVEFLVYRNGVAKKILFTFDQVDLSPIKKLVPGEDPFEYEIFGGMLIQPLTMNHIQALISVVPMLIKYVEFKNQIQPLLVITHVVPGSQLDRLTRIREGSIITHVDQIPVATIDEFKNALKSVINHDRVLFKTVEGAVFVFDIKKALIEERKLSKLYQYPLSPFIENLIKISGV